MGRSGKGRSPRSVRRAPHRPACPVCGGACRKAFRRPGNHPSKGENMATAVVLNLPEHGHMNATYALVEELVRRGDRVTYFATEPFRHRIESTGAEYAAYAEPFTPPAHTGGLY